MERPGAVANGWQKHVRGAGGAGFRTRAAAPVAARVTARVGIPSRERILAALSRGPLSKSELDRTFNEEYKAVMRHLGMEPRTDGRRREGAKWRRRGEQWGAQAPARAKRCSCAAAATFADQAEYERFIVGVTRKANAGRGPRVAEDIEAM